MIDGYDAAPALGSLTFAIFLAAMTLAPLVRARRCSTATAACP